MNHTPVRLSRLLYVLVLVSACSGPQGLNRQAMQTALHGRPEVVTQRDIADTLALQAQLPSPARLALYFKHNNFPGHSTVRRVDWVTADAERLQEALAPLKEEGRLAQVFLLADSTVQGPTLRDIRQAAARYHADAVFVIDGAAAVDRYNNGHAAWYATGLGAYVAHGTESHALCVMEGTLWDVRSGYVYGTQTAEGETTLIGPAASLEDRDALAQAKDVALTRFGRETVDMLRLLYDKPRAARQ